MTPLSGGPARPRRATGRPSSRCSRARRACGSPAPSAVRRSRGDSGGPGGPGGPGCSRGGCWHTRQDHAVQPTTGRAAASSPSRHRPPTTGCPARAGRAVAARRGSTGPGGPGPAFTDHLTRGCQPTRPQPHHNEATARRDDLGLHGGHDCRVQRHGQQAYGVCGRDAVVPAPFDHAVWNGSALHGRVRSGELAEWSCDAIGWLAEIVADAAAQLGVRSPPRLTVSRRWHGNTASATGCDARHRWPAQRGDQHR